MAFEKRTWLARLGQGLNKFFIGEKDAEGKQELTNAPDSITQQGDVISADNLNDLEDRIDNAIKGVMMGELVWENASPKMAFGQQTVTLNNIPSASNHVFAIEYVKRVVDEGYFDSSIATKRVFFNGSSIAPTKYSNTYILKENDGTKDYIRGVLFRVATSSIAMTFNGGNSVENGITSSDDYAIVPLRVYLFS